MTGIERAGYHEAGHALGAWAAGWRVHRLTIDRADPGGKTEGTCWAAVPASPNRADYLRYLLCGATAEYGRVVGWMRPLRGGASWGWRHDFAKVRSVIERANGRPAYGGIEHDPLFRLAWGRAGQLCTEHAAGLVFIAALLEKHKEISGATVARVFQSRRAVLAG